MEQNEIWKIYAIKGNFIGEDKIYEDIKEDGYLWRDNGYKSITAPRNESFKAFKLRHNSICNMSIVAIRRLSDNTIFAIGDTINFLDSPLLNFKIDYIDELENRVIRLYNTKGDYITSDINQGSFQSSRVTVIKGNGLITPRVEMVEFEW